MRWFVEVSPSGGGGVGGSRYCLEGKQWQLALQEVRKALGDTGPLSKLTIELMDGGYRALNPATKARYTIKKAPDDAALTAPEAASTASPVSAPVSAAPTVAPASEPPAPAAPKVASEPPATPVTLPDEPRPPSAAVGAAPAAKASTASIVIPPDEPPSPVAATAAPTAAPPIDHHLIRGREEEPTEKAPITYREYAYAVRPGTSLAVARELILERFRAVALSLQGAPPGKFVQLAVFDYVYDARPTAPPLVTLAWKDWRGEPVLQYPAGGGPAEVLEGALPRAAGPQAAVVVEPTPAPVSAAPAPEPEETIVVTEAAPEETIVVTEAAPEPEETIVVTEASPEAPPASEAVSASSEAAAAVSEASTSASSEAGAPEAAESGAAAPEPAAPSASEAAAPEAVAVEAPRVEQPPAAVIVAPAPASTPAPTPEATIIVADDIPAASASTVPAADAAPPAAEAPAGSEEPALAKSREVTKRVNRNKSSGSQSAKRRLDQTTRPDTPSQKLRAVSRRRAEGEELISELFETMHDLHFMPDLVSGCEFTLALLQKSIPSEGVLVQIYDINKREFVVVRAEGKAPRDSLLYRTPDTDAILRDILRAPRARRFADASVLDGARWQALQITPQTALVGPVRQGGRYLGVVELCNPAGGGEYFDTEVNALDYICEQLAEFVAQRPIVLDPDVVLPEHR
ncbi:MAG: GAF domain-containing protein [Polyangiaceae bacterium]|nr:GAF domain-containing protein [Polyangiaceae bacterium]MCW5789531.1 GAF domain-containing protein [Polyangiaceae bacterium]